MSLASGSRINPRLRVLLLVAALWSPVAAAPWVSQSSSVSEIPIWTGDDVPLPSGGITADGRFLAFADFDGLHIRDLSINRTETRPLAGGTAFNARPSPDGRWVAIGWADNSTRTHQLRVMALSGGPPQTLYQLAAGDVSPLAWTKDNKEVVAWISRTEGGGSLTAIALSDGKQRPLATTSSGIDVAAVSPDGGLIAYAAANEVRTVKVDGSQDTLLFSDPSGVEVMSWLPDGQQLLYRSNKSGTLGAWVVRVQNAKASGSHRLVKANLERTEPIGFGPDGRLYVYTRRGGLDLHTVPLNAATGRRAGTVSTLLRREPGVTRNQGAWAPDNARVAYVRMAPLRPTSIVVQNTKTGTAEDFPLKADVIERLVWHPGGQRIAMIVEDAQGQGVFELDLGNRTFTRILGPTNAVEYSRDGDHLIYRRPRTVDPASAIVKRRLDTGLETILYAGAGAFFTAPDDASFLLYRRATKSLWYGNLAGPDRQVVAEIPDTSHEVALSRNGRFAYYVRTAPWDVWMVPVAGGEPVALGANVHGVELLMVKPDGTGLLISGGNATFEVSAWAGIK